MEITGKFLLNSAENIVRGRKAQESTEKGTALPEAEAAVRMDGGLQSRLLGMQSTLSEIQRAYSREQVRHDYLKEHPDEISEKLQFNGEPLFPELNKRPDRKELLFLVETNLNDLRTRLKSAQVEMENHLALQFTSGESLGFEKLDLSAGIAGSRLDPERVAKLTRQDHRA